MLVTLSAPDFDIDGSIDFQSKDLRPDGETRRRNTRTPTANGGVSLVDRGISVGDKTLNFTWNTISSDHNSSITRLIETFPRLHVSTQFAAYLVAPGTFIPGTDESSIELMILERLS